MHGMPKPRKRPETAATGGSKVLAAAHKRLAGAHNDRRTKRNRTRSNQRRAAIQESE